MTETETAYDWGCLWCIQRGALDMDEDARYNLVEEIMRDYDMHNPDALTDEQWDDVCYAIRERLEYLIEDS